MKAKKIIQRTAFDYDNAKKVSSAIIAGKRKRQIKIDLNGTVIKLVRVCFNTNKDE